MNSPTGFAAAVPAAIAMTVLACMIHYNIDHVAERTSASACEVGLRTAGSIDQNRRQAAYEQLRTTAYNGYNG